MCRAGTVSEPVHLPDKQCQRGTGTRHGPPPRSPCLAHSAQVTPAIKAFITVIISPLRCEEAGGRLPRVLARAGLGV